MPSTYGPQNTANAGTWSLVKISIWSFPTTTATSGLDSTKMSPSSRIAFWQRPCRSWKTSGVSRPASFRGLCSSDHFVEVVSPALEEMRRVGAIRRDAFGPVFPRHGKHRSMRSGESEADASHTVSPLFRSATFDLQAGEKPPGILFEDVGLVLSGQETRWHRAAV